MSTFANEVYTVGWICALKTEYVAAKTFLDETHLRPQYVAPNDNNNYTLGRICDHNVVVAVLPSGEYGTANAACVARDMLHSFPNVRIGLMVGIGGGAPTKNDIRLGDIVVSSPSHGLGGVLQYDFGKTIQGEEFLQTGFLNKPPPALLSAVNGLAADYEMQGHQLEEAINEAFEKYPRLRKGYERRKPSSDRLYRSDVVHPPNGESSCEIVCGDDQSSSLKVRPERTEEEDNPAIHYGLVASANQLMKDALLRDRFAAEKNVLCFEMEAAGLMNHFPCLVIRGICDYSDSHKNKEWQGYAAMAAAAYAKDLLRQVSPTSVEAERRIIDIVDDIKGKVEDVHTIVHDQKRQEILDWITPIDYDSQHNDLMGRRQGTTGKWFLESERFQAWMKNEKETLFCPGIPGAGKTIMTAIVISHLCQEFAGSDTGIAYIYCNYQRQSEQKAGSLLASILKQLARRAPSTPKHVSDLYDRFQEDRIRPSFEEISKSLRAVAAKYSRVFFIIDALDECDPSDNNRARFLNEIFALQTQSGTNIFATSRNIGEISALFAPGSFFPISAHVEDVEAYLDARLAYLDTEIFDDQFLVAIKPKVLEAVDGMFLLAKLHIDLLAAQNTKGDTLEALQSLGKGEKELYKTYEQTVERINSQGAPSRDLAWRILEWIVFSKRPLSTAELQHALATRKSTRNLDGNFIPPSKALQSVCAGLVTIDKESDVVRLDHYTIQEFFWERGNDLFPDAASHITWDCVNYLSFDEFESGMCQSKERLVERLSTHSLYNYAALNWGGHAFGASTPCERLIDFLKCPKKIDASLQVLFSDTYGNFEHQCPLRTLHASTGTTGLHLAAFFGLHDVIGSLLADMQPDSKDVHGGTPLFWAAERGHDSAVKLLLAQAEVDPEVRDIWGQTPLWIAAERNQTDVIKSLIQAKVDPEARDKRGRTPLFIAAKRGWSSAVKLLLDLAEANPDPKDKLGITPLLRVIGKEHHLVVKELLNTGKVDVNAKDALGQTPLFVAVILNQAADVELILSNPYTDVNCKDGFGRTPLQHATKMKTLGMLELLLGNDNLDVNVRDENGQTPLHRAVRDGQDNLIKLLLCTGRVDVDARDKYGKTPLWYALHYGKQTLVNLLFEHGAISWGDRPKPWDRIFEAEPLMIGRRGWILDSIPEI